MSAIAEKLTPDTYRPLSEEGLGYSADPLYIDRIHDLLGCDLPGDYLEFLRRYPATGLCHDYITDDSAYVEGIESYPGAPRALYSMDIIFGQSDIDTSDLIWNIENSDKSDEKLVWIARNTGPQTFGMMLEKDRYGFIYCFDWDMESGNEPLVARSFSDFIDRIVFLSLDKVRHYKSLS